MARQRDSLVLVGIIGDVVDMFTPSVKLNVIYQCRQVINACQFKPSELLSPPRLEIQGADSESFFTLVMSDPDVPSPGQPTIHEYLHWIVTDIPAAPSNGFGRELVSYEGPNPRIGIHRNVFTLFKQKGRESVVYDSTSRHNFKTREFASLNSLGLPVACVYFNARKETTSALRRYK